MLDQKKKIVVLPSSGIFEYLGRSVRKLLFFFNHFFFKQQKVQNLGAFSTFFLKKGEKNTQFDKNWVHSQLLIFLKFYFSEMGQSLGATQHFFSWPYLEELLFG